MKAIKFFVGCALSAVMFSAMPVMAESKEVVNLDQLLKVVKDARRADNADYIQRERQFATERGQQAQVLANMKSQRQSAERLSEALSQSFDDNDASIEQGKERLAQALGNTKELFGHLTTAAGDVRSNLGNSLINQHFSDRTEFLDELIASLTDTTETPNIEMIERLWFEMLREMVEQGKVVKFNTTVSTASGEKKKVQAVRVGSFNIFTKEGEYLSVNDQTGDLEVLPRQPDGKFMKQAAALFSAKQGFTQVGIDPTGPSGGSYLGALVDSPTLQERWHQGGTVGYIISAVGVFGLLIALWRLVALAITSAKVKRQLKIEQPSTGNPLGRVLNVYENNRELDPETLELKLSEQVIQEVPKLESSLNLIKIISAVAPLLGLLGTVTGMIITFQAITIFGAGDPKAMAGGISGALVTTVLGLVVAIPMVLLHTLLSSRSKSIVQILEERTTGIIAERHEETHRVA